jgi:hypothetical protein
MREKTRTNVDVCPGRPNVSPPSSLRSFVASSLMTRRTTTQSMQLQAPAHIASSSPLMGRTALAEVEHGRASMGRRPTVHIVPVAVRGSCQRTPPRSCPFRHSDRVMCVGKGSCDVDMIRRHPTTLHPEVGSSAAS